MTGPTQLGVTSSGLRYPEGTDQVNAGATNIRNLAEDVTVRGAKLLGAAVMAPVTLGATGGTLGLTQAALTIAAVPYPRIVQVSLVETLGSATTFCTFTIRQGGTAVNSGGRATTPQHTFRTVWTELVPANTSRSYDATVTSSAAATVPYNVPGVAELTAVGWLAA